MKSTPKLLRNLYEKLEANIFFMFSFITCRRKYLSYFRWISITRLPGCPAGLLAGCPTVQLFGWTRFGQSTELTSGDQEKKTLHQKRFLPFRVALPHKFLWWGRFFSLVQPAIVRPFGRSLIVLPEPVLRFVSPELHVHSRKQEESWSKSDRVPASSPWVWSRYPNPSFAFDSFYWSFIFIACRKHQLLFKFRGSGESVWSGSRKSHGANQIAIGRCPNLIIS